MSKMAEARLALKRHVIVERESDEDDLVLIDSRTGRMSACNETASILVAELENGATIGRLVKALSSRFAVAPEVATRDVNGLLDVLAAEGLLESAD
jgi:gamma-glutamyl phosphate reductase